MPNSVYRKKIILCVVLILSFATIFLLYGLPQISQLKSPIVRNSFTYNQNTRNYDNQSHVSMQFNWKNADLMQHEIPSQVTERIPKMSVQSNRITINECDISYLEVDPENAENELSVLLLHGMSFTSKTWLELETIQTLSALGYRTVAIDLPGFGSSGKSDANLDRTQFLYNTIDKLGLKAPVIVSPSFSGHFSLPFLLKYWNIMGGYVPVSPVGNNVLLNHKCSESITAQQTEHLLKLPEKLQTYLKAPYPDLSCVQVPTMIVFGENDNNQIGLESSAYLSLLPLSQVIQIPNGSHPAYLSNKHLWHKLLYNFLNLIARKSV